MIRLFGSVNRASIDRPRLWWDWIDRHTFYVALAWGNGYSDPVWEVGAEGTVPERVSRLADRWYAWRGQNHGWPITQSGRIES